MQAFYVRDASGSMIAGTARVVGRPEEDTTVIRIQGIDKGISHYSGELTYLEIIQKSSDFVFENVKLFNRLDSLAQALQFFAKEYFSLFIEDTDTHNLIENIFIDPTQEFVGAIEALFGWME